MSAHGRVRRSELAELAHRLDVLRREAKLRRLEAGDTIWRLYDAGREDALREARDLALRALGVAGAPGSPLAPGGTGAPGPGEAA